MRRKYKSVQCGNGTYINNNMHSLMLSGYKLGHVVISLKELECCGMNLAGVRNVSKVELTSVTRLGDLLDFVLLFIAFGNN